MTSHARSLAALPEPEAHVRRPAGKGRLARPGSRIGAPLLPAAGRWAALAATVLCTVARVPDGLQTPLATALPLLAIPFAVMTAFSMSRAFDFSVGAPALFRRHSGSIFTSC
jgi:hypothetical protein